jgi:short-subunit dehydrogenase
MLFSIGATEDAASGRAARPGGTAPFRQTLLSEPRVAVVTGGGTGIGAALARGLAGRGWKCILLGRREDPLRRLADEIGGEYEVCDVADREAVQRTAASVQERHPAVALLVNNAGIPGRSNFLDVDPERAEQLIRINYLGSLWCARAFLPALEAARNAQVVNVVSVAGTVGVGPYSASKHAQLALSRSLAAELRPRGILVLTVNPGFVHTEGFPQDRLRRGRFGSLVVGPEYVADRILRALERGRIEIFVPGWYRPAAWIQAVAPGAVARLRSRRTAS